MGCNQRVWDSGDMTDCGKPTVGKSEVCEECGSDRIKFFNKQIQEAKQTMATATKKLRVLRREMRQQK